ncbi:MAG: metallophosphoesterase [Lachnospiraceae bacterium]|nr:metallophosphoesterase [Lachnospiraceae bacterium]
MDFNKFKDYVKKHKIKTVAFAFLIILFIYIMTGLSEEIEYSYYDITSDRLPSDFDNCKIIHISDFHDKELEDYDSFIKKIASEEPDFIFLTGDIMDKGSTDLTQVDRLLSDIVDIAPVYAIDGNHEHDNYPVFYKLADLYKDYGVTFLFNETISITADGTEVSRYINGEGTADTENSDNTAQTIDICGVAYVDEVYITGTYHRLKALNDDSPFSIMLYHCSNLFDEYYYYNYDLILAGHTHGGIIRFPLVGGLLSNDGTFFPKYTFGKFTKGKSTLIASKGLGDSILPRIHDKPDVGIITLHCK